MGRLETPSLLVREKISQNFAHAKIGIGELPAVGIGEIGILAPALVVSPSCGRPYRRKSSGWLNEVGGECLRIDRHGHRVQEQRRRARRRQHGQDLQDELLDHRQLCEPDAQHGVAGLRERGTVAESSGASSAPGGLPHRQRLARAHARLVRRIVWQSRRAPAAFPRMTRPEAPEYSLPASNRPVERRRPRRAV